ncbi:hypothetical protein ACOSQ2_009938 [Xanthoceras sorbifolium]
MGEKESLWKSRKVLRRRNQSAKLRENQKPNMNRDVDSTCSDQADNISLHKSVNKKNISCVKPGDRKGRKTLDAWNHFTLYEDGGRMKAQCNYCPQTYACGTGASGTSNMLRHTKKQCKNYKAKLADEDPKQMCLVELK